VHAHLYLRGHSSLSRTALLMIALCLTCACLVHHKSYGVQHHVQRLAGDGALNCGTIPAQPLEPDPQLVQVIAECMSGAYRLHQPFFFLREQRSIDSFVVTGIVGTDQGQLFQVWYDSAPCGGPGCRERFEATACSPSQVERQALDPFLQCK